MKNFLARSAETTMLLFVIGDPCAVCDHHAAIDAAKNRDEAARLGSLPFSAGMRLCRLHAEEIFSFLTRKWPS